MSKNQKLPPLDGTKGETPDKITRITEKYMFDYIENFGTVADIEWFAETCEKYTEKKMKNGVEYTGIKVSDVRKEFALRFFKKLVEKEDDTPVSIGDKLTMLKAKAKANNK